MKSIIHAIYENGVFRPLEPVSLPEHARVLVQMDAATVQGSNESLDEIDEILMRRYRSVYSDTAARHDEHQP